MKFPDFRPSLAGISKLPCPSFRTEYQFLPNNFGKKSSGLICHALLLDENHYALTFGGLQGSMSMPRVMMTRNINSLTPRRVRAGTNNSRSIDFVQ
jgi:hypothetical protein